MSNHDWEQPGSNHHHGQQPYPGQQPQFDQQPKQPQFQGQGGAPRGPSADALSLTEGWGNGQSVSFDELKARFSIVRRRASGSIFQSWLALALLPLALTVLSGVLTILLTYVPVIGIVGVFGSMALNLLLLPVTIALSVAQWALMRPMYARIFEDPSERSVKETILSIKGVFIATLAVVAMSFVGMFLGFIFCVLPGFVIAFLLSQSVYLTAGAQLGPVDALKKSVELTKRHWMNVIMIIAAMFVVAFASGMIFVPVGFASAIIHPFGDLVGGVVAWALSQTSLFIAFMLHATVFSAIETKETGRMPV